MDDNPLDNYLHKKIISDLQLVDEIILKETGEDAIAYLQKECQQSDKYPNLILLDLKMPGMNGIKFLKEFEKVCLDAKEDIYVVILTHSQDPDDLIAILQIGNYYHIQKPLTTDKFLDIHHRFFRDLV